MNPDVKAKWLAALRSGDYYQGTGWLCQPDQPHPQPWRVEFDGSVPKVETLCCLGVLCELAVKEGVTTRQEADSCDDDNKKVIAYGDEEAQLTLPTEVRVWAGLDSPNPVILTNATTSFLNDGYKMAFTHIADLVEKFL